MEEYLPGHDEFGRHMEGLADRAAVSGSQVAEDLDVLGMEVELELEADFEGGELLAELVVVVHPVGAGGNMVVAREGRGGGGDGGGVGGRGGRVRREQVGFRRRARRRAAVRLVGFGRACVRAPAEREPLETNTVSVGVGVDGAGRLFTFLFLFFFAGPSMVCGWVLERRQSRGFW